MKIKTKYFLYSIGITFLLITLILGTLYFIMPKYYADKKQQTAENTIEKLRKDYQGLSLSGIEESLNEYSKTIQGFQIQLLTEEGDVLFPKSSYISVDGYGSVTESQDLSELKIQQQQPTIKEAITTKDGQTYYLSATIFFQPIDEASQVLLDIYPYTILVSLFVSGVGSFLFASFSTSRIRKITETTQKMLDSYQSPLLDVRGNDELTELAENISTLHSSLAETIQLLETEIDKVAEMEQNKTEFMRIASHELKSPIMTLTSLVDGMIHNIGDYQNRDKYLALSQEILQRQSKLVQEILFAVKGDFSRLKYQKQELDLVEIIQQELLQRDSLIQQKNIQLQVDLTTCNFPAIKEDVTKVITNLLDNGVKYTVTGGKIYIILKEQQLEIINETQPIAEDALKQIFNPFYRPDYARNIQDGGVGLGLYIVKKILLQNHWNYHFLPLENGRFPFQGMVFKIDFR